MCQLKSGIVLKNRVFVPDYDSHEEMLKELGIEDNAINAMKTFVRFELSPVDDDIFSDIDTWELSVDQDILPDWWDEETYKPKVVEAVKEWATGHIHVRKNDLVINDGIHYVKDSIVKAYGYSIVEAWNNSTVHAYNNSIVGAWNNSTVNAYNYSTVTAKGFSTIISKYAWDFNKNLKLTDNSTYKDCHNRKIHQAGDWEIVKV